MSISPFELRLGNLVNIRNEEGIIYSCTVVSISNNSISVMKDGTGMVVEPEHLSPITLTEGWMWNLGFEYWGIGKGYVLYNVLDGSGNFSVALVFEDNYTLYLDGEDFFMNELKYVHQLQNIYSIIAGHELTIKETV